MLVYLATPIDQSGSSIPSWCPQPEIRRALVNIGCVVYTPSAAFAVTNPEGENARAIDVINDTALTIVDVVVAVLPAGVPTLGVPAEITTALAANNTTVIIATDIKYGVQIAAWEDQGAIIVRPPQDAVAREVTAIVADKFAEADRAYRPSAAFKDEMLGILRDTHKQANFQPFLFPPAPAYGDVTSFGHQPIQAESLTPVSTCKHGRSQVDVPGLLYTRTSSNAKALARAHSNDAGFDLAVVGEHEIHPGSYSLLPTGIVTAIPEGYWGLIIGRSSSWTKWEFDIRLGVIDEGYRGELLVGVHNRGAKTRIIQPGTRLAQYVLIPSFRGGVAEVKGDELTETSRGTGGFGSTGR